METVPESESGQSAQSWASADMSCADSPITEPNTGDTNGCSKSGGSLLVLAYSKSTMRAVCRTTFSTHWW